MITGRSRKLSPPLAPCRAFLFCAAIPSIAQSSGSALKVLRLSALVLPSLPSVKRSPPSFESRLVPFIFDSSSARHPLRHPRPPCRQTSILRVPTPRVPRIPSGQTRNTSSPPPPTSSTRLSSSHLPPSSSPSPTTSLQTPHPPPHRASPNHQSRRMQLHKNLTARRSSSPLSLKPLSSPSFTRTSLDASRSSYTTLTPTPIKPPRATRESPHDSMGPRRRAHHRRTARTTRSACLAQRLPSVALCILLSAT